MSNAPDSKPPKPSLSRRGALGALGAAAAAAWLAPHTASAGEPAASPVQGDPLCTRLTRGYGLRYPFVSAGMAFVGLPELAIAVSNAGGLGMLGAATEPDFVLQARLAETREGTSRPFGVDLILSGEFVTDRHIEVSAGVSVVTFHWGLPPRRWVEQLQAAGTRVWVQAGALDFAQEALALGVDGIVAQGKEAAGHNRSTVPLLQLLREVRQCAGEGVVVLAAGGIADGLTAARALRHGADGVWVGTRLVASKEAYAHDCYKQRIVEGGADDSRFTTLFGPEWPGQRQRVLRNRVVREWAGREEQVPVPPPPLDTVNTTVLFPGVVGQVYTMPKFSAFVPTRDTQGDFEEMDMPASGASMARIKSVQPAGLIVEEMMEGARRLLLRPEELDAEA